MQEYMLEQEGGTLICKREKAGFLVTGWQGDGGELTVPGYIEGVPVVGVAKKAFMNQPYLRRVSIEAPVREIGDWAFANSHYLEHVRVPENALFGKVPFKGCSSLKSVTVGGADQGVARLLAAALVLQEAYYLLGTDTIGDEEWLYKWDVGLRDFLKTDDSREYYQEALCGEAEADDQKTRAYITEHRKKKVRLCFVRLLHNRGLTQENDRYLKDYILSHTKGCASEEAWQVVKEEFGEMRQLYELFADLGGVNEGNMDELLADLGDSAMEMKAFFLGLQEKWKKDRGGDFFDSLELDF